MEDTNFKILAGLVNQAKHKYFPRVLKHADFVNDRYHVLMRNVEYFMYPNEKKTKCVLDELDVLEFVKTVQQRDASEGLPPLHTRLQRGQGMRTPTTFANW